MAWLGRFDDFNNGNVDVSVKTYRGKQTSHESVYGGTSQLLRESHQFGHLGSGYCPIRGITKDMQNVSIKGVIIAKEGPKTVVSKKGNGNERHLLGLTVCDEPLAFMNVTCWGGKEFISILADELFIGDVVDIRGAHLQAKSSNPSDEKFKPWTPSTSQLSISENQGTIAPYKGADAADYFGLLHTPTRANNDFYTLEDIQANGMNLQGEHINILAVVKKIWPVREIVTKLGKRTVKVEAILCDETCPSFNLTLWDSFVHMAETWIPMETVIFAADVRISFNDFHSTMAASTDSKTIFTVDPDTPEAQSLRHFCRHQSSLVDNEESTFETNGKDPDVNTITNVITVREAKDIQTDAAYNAGQPQFGLIFAFLSHFDIDSDERFVFRNVCSRCHRRVQKDTDLVCGNPDCTGSNTPLENNVDAQYSFSISLTDHTGTLDFCQVPPHVAETLLGYKARDFKNLAEVQKTAIKWCYLFERVRAVVKIKKTNGERERCLVRVLALEKPSISQLVEHSCADM